VPNNLPAELTSFIGRSTELAELSELLGQVRLLTLTGAGGCGKTRLARHVAAATLDGHLDGVWWVELARLADATLVPAAVIGALGLREVLGRALLDTLVEYLRTRRCWSSWTTASTCWPPLGVPGEVTWRVPSMSLPAEPACEPIETLRMSDAFSLFIDRVM
jgi:predicted ATPase